jgi:hypothetical protein
MASRINAVKSAGLLHSPQLLHVLSDASVQPTSAADSVYSNDQLRLQSMGEQEKHRRLLNSILLCDAALGNPNGTRRLKQLEVNLVLETLVDNQARLQPGATNFFFWHIYPYPCPVGNDSSRSAGGCSCQRQLSFTGSAGHGNLPRMRWKHLNLSRTWQ